MPMAMTSPSEIIDESDSIVQLYTQDLIASMAKTEIERHRPPIKNTKIAHVVVHSRAI
jgi:hypothetical protein